MDGALNGIVTIATAIVGLAILAVLVSKNADTGNVIGAATSGFAKDIQAAVSPLSGSGVGLGSTFNGGGFTPLF